MTANPSDPHIGLVVEGPGDVKAVPVLLRKWMTAHSDYRDVLGKPVSCNGRQKALAPRGLEGFVAVAAARPGCRAVLVLLDGEGDPVCKLGPELLRRAKSVTGFEVAICLAENNFEDWIYASAETLSLPNTVQFDAAKSGLHAIKSALRPQAYVKPTWQPRLTSQMDLEAVQVRSSSVSRLFIKFQSLLRALERA